MSRNREDAARREEALRSRTARPATSSPVTLHPEDDIDHPPSTEPELSLRPTQPQGPSVVGSSHLAYVRLRVAQAQVQLQLQMQAQAQAVRNAAGVGATFDQQQQQQQQTPPLQIGNHDHVFRTHLGNRTKQSAQQRPYGHAPHVAGIVPPGALNGFRGSNVDQLFVHRGQLPSGFPIRDITGLHSSNSFPTVSPSLPSNTHIFQSQLSRRDTRVLQGSSDSPITTDATPACRESSPNRSGFQRAQATMDDRMNGSLRQFVTPRLILRIAQQNNSSVNIQPCLNLSAVQNTQGLSSYEKSKEKKKLAQEKREQEYKEEIEQQAREHQIVEETRRRLQEEHPGWRDELRWQVDEPEYYDTTLRQYLQRIYPGASANLIDELVTQESHLLMRIQSTVLRADTRPDLSLRQLLTLALIARPDRTANQEELVRWLERRYPWYAYGLFRDTDGSERRSTLREHVGAFLDQMAGSYDRDFEPVDPSTHTHEEGTYVGDDAGLVWRLLPSRESSILINPVPPVRLLALPPELHFKVLDEYLSYPRTLYAIQERNKVSYYIECPESPEWLAHYSATIRFNGIARNVYLLHRGPLTDPFTFAQSVWGAELTTDAFFRHNTIAIGNRNLNGDQAWGTNVLSHGPLSTIGERGRRNFSSVDFDLVIRDHSGYQRRSDINQAFRLLGQSQHLEELTLRLEIHGQSLLAARQHRFHHIPGFQILRRFRGIRQFTLVVTSPTPPILGAPPDPESWIEVVEEWLRSRITQPILRLDGSRKALRNQPKEPSTLMSYGRKRLYDEARPYGFNPDTSRLSNGEEFTIKKLALWVSEQQHIDCEDPDFRSANQWEKKASGIYLIQVGTQDIALAGERESAGGPVETSPKITESVPSLFGGPSPNPADKGETRTTMVLDPSSTGTEQVNEIVDPDEGEQEERPSYAKRKEPPTDKKGNGRKRPRSK